MSRRKVKTFDPSAELGKLISSLKRKTGIRSEVDPRTSPLALTLRRKTSGAAFSRCIVPRVIAVALRCCSARLNASRVARRAVRTADEYGAPCAPQTAAGSSNASAVSATPHSTHVCPLTTSQGDVSDGL